MHPREYAKRTTTKSDLHVAAPDTHIGCTTNGTIDPRVFGLAKAAYSVSETLEQLSIGRTSLYAAVKLGELKPVKFGKKTLFYASDIAAFLSRLQNAA